MAEVVWSEPALANLDAIADYIALENPAAAEALVTLIFQHIDQLEHVPQSGSAVPGTTRVMLHLELETAT